MNPFTDLLFTIIWFGLLVWAVRTMARGWNSMGVDPKEIKYTESSKQITRPPHPELAEVKPGDELLVVNFTPDEEFSNRVKESDNFLQQSLQDRIEELVEDEDDDDEGGAPVLANSN